MGAFGATFAIEDNGCLTFISETNEGGAHGGAGSFIRGPGDPDHQLIGLQRSQESAAEIGEEPEFPVAANEFPFSLCRS
jgi:hypothetical protein